MTATRYGGRVTATRPAETILNVDLDAFYA